MDRYQYLLLLLGCFLITLPLEVVLGARVYRRPRRLARAIGLPVVLFVVWDIVAIGRDEWSFNPRYVTGLQIPFGVPVEEVAFFVVIPCCALLTFEVCTRLGRRRR
jgi:lycopene cyclase domain-containing protein